MNLAANRKVQLTVALVLTVLAVSGEGTGTVMVQSSLAPKSAVVMVGRTQPLTFNPGSGAGSTLTGWVNLVAGGNSTVGTIDANGLYTAPAVPPSPNTVKILVRSGTMTAVTVLTILNPAPSISSVTPTVTMAGSENTMVTVRGAGFTPQSVIKADGTTLTTTFISNNELTASIPATTLASTGVTQIQVSTPAPGGGKSAPLPLTALSPGIVAGTANPQLATYTITSPRFANVTIEFGPDTSYGLRTWTQPTSQAGNSNNPCPKPHGECRGGTVSIFVARMKTFTTYHMRAIVDFPEGKEFLDADHTFTTGGPDPSRLPKFNLVVPPGPGTTPGVVLYSMINTSGTLPGPLEFVATDMQGNVIWYYIPPDLPSAGAFPIKLLDNGHMLEGVNPTGGLREIDLAGNIIRELSV